MTRNTKIAILIAAFLGIVGVICVVRALQLKEFQDIKEKVTVGIARESLSALAIIAEDQGFFSQEGLDAQTIYYDSGKLALNGMFDGEVDLATVADTPVVFSSFEREDFYIISSIGFSDNEPRIIARKDAGIQKPGDLHGKRIATQEASAVHFFLHLFLVKNGMSEKNIELYFKNPDELVPALVNGEVDALSMREPFISNAKTLLEENAVVFAEPGLYIKTFNLIALKNFVKNQPRVVTKVLRALMRSEEFARKNPVDAARIVADALGVAEPEMEALWYEINVEISLSQSLLLSLEDEARWAIGSGLTDRPEVPNYLNFIYLDGLEKLRPESITLIH